MNTLNIVNKITDIEIESVIVRLDDNATILIKLEDLTEEQNVIYNNYVDTFCEVSHRIISNSPNDLEVERTTSATNIVDEMVNADYDNLLESSKGKYTAFINLVSTLLSNV